MGFGASEASLAGKPKRPSRAEKSTRSVWVGLAAGPISPKSARALERSIVELLRAEEQLTVVDVGGRPVSRAAERRAEAEHEARYEAGIRALLREDHELALRELDAAASLFSRTLAGLRDHHRRHETLVAKAAVLMATSRKEAAREVLRELAALDPGRAAPTRDNQSEALVQLYEEALRSRSREGLLRFEGETAGTRLRLDGRDLGDAPFPPTKLGAGRHLLFIRTPSLQRVEVIELGAGEERTVRLPGEGPEDRQRGRFLEDLSFRPAQLEDAAKKVAKLAAAERLIVGWTRREDDAVKLYLGRLDPEGKPECIVRATLEETPDRALQTQLAAALDPRRRGGFDLSKDGKLKAEPTLAGAAFGRRLR